MTTTSNGGVINATNGIKDNQTAAADPYGGVTIPTKTGATLLNAYTYNNNNTYQITPGQWTNGVTFSNGAKVNFAPGVYFVDKGTFNVQSSTLTGSGVTIVLSNTGSNYANVSISNGASVTLSAPTSGATQGIVFFSDRNAPLTPGQTFQGGSTLNLTGALYFPSTRVVYSNGVVSNPSSNCTQLIAGTIQFQGGANFAIGSCPTGVTSIGAGATKLVE
jgi:hypothetical protein